MKPVVDRLRERYEGRVDIRVLVLDEGGEEEESLADQFGVEYVPTFAFVDSDGTRRGEIVGATTEAELGRRLDALR